MYMYTRPAWEHTVIWSEAGVETTLQTFGYGLKC